jgi:putative copper resistance protein D
MRPTPPPRLALPAAAIAALAAGPVLAHGGTEPTPALPAVLFTVVPDPVPWVGTIVAAAGYLLLAGRVNAAHPASRVPGWRTAAWLAGIGAILVALVSAIDVYADDLLTVHMVQHLLLTMVAPPLLALGAPVTLVMRSVRPVTRRRLLLPILHSRLVRLAASPFVAWPIFTAVMWFAHFSPIYEAALEQPAIHVAEHAIFLGAGVLFWWPVVGADPIPRRMGHGARFAYLVLQMPVNAAVGLAIYWAPLVLYPHYLAVERAWGPSPLVDQQVGGLVMWAAGDLLLLAAVAAIVAGWMRAEGRRAGRADGRCAVLAAAEDSRPER